MTKLTTHVLDTANGLPAKKMTIRLARVEGNARVQLLETETNNDGRCDQPLLAGEAMIAGSYELEFEVADYFKEMSKSAEFPFLDCVVIRFGITDPQSHYHVPLLVSPFGYSTYRGS